MANSNDPAARSLASPRSREIQLAIRRPANLVSRLDFVTLKLFLAIVEEQSFSKAAERECIAASAVSKRIADLEIALHVQLLHRQRKGMQPTEAGEALLHYARSILRDVARLEGELADYAMGARGVVRVVASESSLMAFVPRALETFNAKHPNIRVDIRALVSSESILALLEGDADLGICWGPSAAQGLDIVPCFIDRLMVVVPFTHPLSEFKNLRFSDIVDYEFIQQEAKSTVQALLERSAVELGRQLRTRIRTSSYDSACSMAQAGFGIAIVPDTYSLKFATTRTMAVIPLNEPWAARQFNLCTRESRDISGQTRILLNHFIESI
ncbi:MAG: LysR family transcriptional regulator [Acidovorax sp.]|uniref:LysR family transcriptional regulator n=1 Tax=Acidovorax sp. TaxID=1872122 RepID=UPI00391C436D